MTASTALETDYLVIGAGASGMAFVDTLLTESDSQIVMIDRRHAPGGHWLDAYPFARLHQPSACYGVNSMALGSGGADLPGSDDGLLERATAAEVCGYYDQVMTHRFLPSGRVRFFPSCDYLGNRRFRSRLSGEEVGVTARRKVVDATYLQSEVPATTPPPFDVAPGPRVVPVGELVRLAEPPSGYMIIGAGKTAQDACVWLLGRGVPPDRIRWIRPRDPWLIPRRYIQPGPGSVTTFEGYARQVEIAAEAGSGDELFAGLEEAGLLVRIDSSVMPTTYKGATVDSGELELLRRIEDVVRLGHVRRIERDRVVLDGGSSPTDGDWIHVLCTARGLNPAPAVPVFDGDVITLEVLRFGFIPFSAALTAYVEANRHDDAEKNELCRPIPMPDSAFDWIRTTLQSVRAAYRWSKHGDIVAWMEQARLNVLAGLLAQAADPRVGGAFQRYVARAREASEKLEALMGTDP